MCEMDRDALKALVEWAREDEAVAKAVAKAVAVWEGALREADEMEAAMSGD